MTAAHRAFTQGDSLPPVGERFIPFMKSRTLQEETFDRKLSSPAERGLEVHL